MSRRAHAAHLKRSGPAGDAVREARLRDVFHHAHKRAYTRYSIDLTLERYREWCELVDAGAARFVGPARVAGNIWAIADGDREVFALFRDGLIRTFLPPEGCAPEETPEDSEGYDLSDEA